MVVEDGAWWLLGGLWWRFKELLVVVVWVVLWWWFEELLVVIVWVVSWWWKMVR